jgi:hypothetical protein
VKQTQLTQRGWCTFPHSEELLSWVDSVQPVAEQLLQDASLAHWWRHGETWFAGVNVLPNDHVGKVIDGPALSDDVCAWVRQQVNMNASESLTWEPGQLSVVKPGYPQRDAQESEAAHRFRYNRDAAHVDGLLPVGEERRRMPQEFHRLILGIPLQQTPAHAAPTVVWEGSHKLIQQAFIETLKDIPIQHWPQTDLTDVYQRIRREVFERCKRVEVHVPPGECYLIHRFAVHGVAPWQAQHDDQNKLRSIVFFRPEIGSRWDWLMGD